jgi:hypothetical protein
MDIGRKFVNVEILILRTKLIFSEGVNMIIFTIKDIIGLIVLAIFVVVILWCIASQIIDSAKEKIRKYFRNKR